MSEELFHEINNVETGEITRIPLTPEEIAERQLWADEQASRIALEEIKNDLKVSAKAKLIAGEPLTPEEADCLVL